MVIGFDFITLWNFYHSNALSWLSKGGTVAVFLYITISLLNFPARKEARFPEPQTNAIKFNRLRRWALIFAWATLSVCMLHFGVYFLLYFLTGRKTTDFNGPVTVEMVSWLWVLYLSFGAILLCLTTFFWLQNRVRKFDSSGAATG